MLFVNADLIVYLKAKGCSVRSMKDANQHGLFLKASLSCNDWAGA